jgi:hypothetical protein
VAWHDATRTHHFKATTIAQRNEKLVLNRSMPKEVCHITDLTVLTVNCHLSLISGSRRDVDVICDLLGNYTASCGNYLPTFRDNVSLHRLSFLLGILNT